MRVSDSQTHVHSHSGGLLRRWWSGSGRAEGFGSLFADQLGSRKSQTGVSSPATAAAPAVQARTATVVATAATAPASASAAQTVATAPTAKPSVASAPSTASAPGAAPASSGGRGLTTESGAPLIIPNSVSASSIYDGPAAYNPYYWSNACPYQEGTVTGYSNWFQSIKVGTFNQSSGQVAYVVNPRYSANLEGGEEALRLVQQFIPDAHLVANQFSCQLPGQSPSYDVELPNGTVLNGGLVLSGYYHEGYGVTQDSDLSLKEICGLIHHGTAA